MAENSKIEWTDHTVNFWWGCTKVSPACANCYAEKQDARFHQGQLHFAHGKEVRLDPHWGPDAPRLLRVEAARREALRFERRAVKEVRRFRVFTNSMADFFEDRRDLDGARLEALDVIRQTPHLDWLILTKRPQAIEALLSRAEEMAWAGSTHTELSLWLNGWRFGNAVPANVWLGTTVEDQERADLRIPALLQVPAVVRFLSCEPLLGPVDLDRIHETFDGGLGHSWESCLTGRRFSPLDDGMADGFRHLDWVICGGESGPHARPMHPDWARSLRDQCAAAGVPFLFKQWGEFAPNWFNDDQGQKVPGSEWIDRMGKKAAGRLLDGVEHNDLPEGKGTD